MVIPNDRVDFDSFPVSLSLDAAPDAVVFEFVSVVVGQRDGVTANALRALGGQVLDVGSAEFTVSRALSRDVGIIVELEFQGDPLAVRPGWHLVGADDVRLRLGSELLATRATVSTSKDWGVQQHVGFTPRDGASMNSHIPAELTAVGVVFRKRQAIAVQWP
jgi:hypothetical protein